MVERRKGLYGFEMREPDLRRNPNRQTHDPKALWQSSHEIIHLALFGHRNVEIAKILGCSAQTVSNVLNGELGERKLSELRQERDAEAIDVQKKVAELYPKAIEIYEEILNSEHASTTLKKETADTILMDIGGYRAPQRSTVDATHLVRAEVLALVARGEEARRSARLNGHIVDLKEGDENA